MAPLYGTSCLNPGKPIFGVETAEWTSSSVILEGGGSLLEAQGCHITVGDLQFQAAVQGATRIQDERTLVLYPPSEEEALERITADQRTLELLSNLSAHDMHAGVDTLLALHPSM
jgi:hypothetical protein